MGYHWIEGKLAINEEEAPIVKRLFEIFRDNRNRRKTARQLNEEGFRTRKGTKWTDNTVTRLLSNSQVVGIRVGNKHEILPGKQHWKLKPEEEWIESECPAIISQEMWDACQLIMKETS